jgi:hypothetical protein
MLSHTLASQCTAVLLVAKYSLLVLLHMLTGARGGAVVEALRYKLEGRWIDS